MKKLFKHAWVGGKNYKLNKVGTHIDFNEIPPKVLDMTSQPQEGWKERFKASFLIVTNPKTWRNGKPILNGYQYVTVYNALESVVSSLLADHDREIIKRIGKLKSEYGGFHERKALSDAIEVVKGGPVYLAKDASQSVKLKPVRVG